VSNFPQPTFKLSNEQGPLRVHQSKKWDKQSKDGLKRVITAPQLRKALGGIMHTPEEVIVEFGADAYNIILGFAQTPEEHVAKFEAQAADRVRKNKAVELAALVAEFLNS